MSVYRRRSEGDREDWWDECLLPVGLHIEILIAVQQRKTLVATIRTTIKKASGNGTYERTLSLPDGLTCATSPTIGSAIRAQAMTAGSERTV